MNACPVMYWLRSWILRLFFLGCIVLDTGCAKEFGRYQIDHVLDSSSLTTTNHFEHWTPSGDVQGEISNPSERPLTPPGNAGLKPGKSYDLSELADLGLRSNPTTRSAWEEARAMAARLGISESTWLPILTTKMEGGYWRYPFPGQGGAFSLEGQLFDPVLRMNFAIFDKTRPAQIDAAMQQLIASNFSFNRNHQTVLFAIQQSFYGLIAAKSKVIAAEATLNQSSRNVEAIKARLSLGLATEPEYLLAVQDQARAGYELQGARGIVMEKQAELAEHVGVRPHEPLETVDLESVELPKDSEVSADEIIDAALIDRPDLSAKLAEIRGREAEIRKAEAAFWPVIGLQADGGWKVWNYHNAGGVGTAATNQSEPVNISSPLVDAFITLDWNIFAGFSTLNSVKAAEAKRNQAEAELEALRLKTMKEVWKAYADFKTSNRKRSFAVAMLKAAEKSYDSALKAYKEGLATVIELLTAEKNLAQARYTDIDSQSSLLLSAAALAYATGTPPQ